MTLTVLRCALVSQLWGLSWFIHIRDVVFTWTVDASTSTTTQPTGNFDSWMVAIKNMAAMAYSGLSSIKCQHHTVESHPYGRWEQQQIWNTLAGVVLSLPPQRTTAEWIHIWQPCLVESGRHYEIQGENVCMSRFCSCNVLYWAEVLVISNLGLKSVSID